MQGEVYERGQIFGAGHVRGFGGVAVPAWGQDGPAAGSGDEIIVTANKRSQNLQDVGLSVSAISGDALKNQQISNLADVAQIVPGLTFSQTANDTPVYTLRG